MLKNFIPQRLAKQLKDLGFDQDCLAYWFEESGISVPTETRGFWRNWNVMPRRISAPFWQQATEYFRTVHNLMASITFSADPFVCYKVSIHDTTTYMVICTIHTYLATEYEGAELASLENLIRIVKERNSNKITNKITNDI